MQHFLVPSSILIGTRKTARDYERNLMLSAGAGVATQRRLTAENTSAYIKNDASTGLCSRRQRAHHQDYNLIVFPATPAAPLAQLGAEQRPVRQPPRAAPATRQPRKEVALAQEIYPNQMWLDGKRTRRALHARRQSL
jgi:hypothetical protein